MNSESCTAGGGYLNPLFNYRNYKIAWFYFS